MRRALIALALAVAVVLSGGALVLANGGSATDPRGDLSNKPASGNSSAVDLVGATFGHASGGRLVHTVSVAGSIANPATAASGVPMIWIEDPVQSNGTRECRYFVGRNDGKLGVFTCGYGDRVAGAKITRTSAHTIRYEFSAGAIGNPSSYAWQVSVKVPTDDGVDEWIDRLPDGDHILLTHRLR
jgi:hypothetical protein